MRKSVLFAFLSVIISGLVLVSPVRFSLAQNSTSFKISGYILDSNGHGVAEARIIFGVPQIVPGVYSDSSGYYEVYAPTGTYHINVWPPFDSNYIYYDEPVFAVESSDISKNITLSSGFKLSGYLSDSSGSPIRGALAYLDQFHCGLYSNNTGYYFVTAPAGTYRLTIRSRTGPIFPTFIENNFALTGDTTKNFTLTLTSVYTVSGYISDSSGNPVSEAVVSLDGFGSGYSNNLGYYFVNVPAGSYDISVTPCSGYDHFSSYFESNFAVNGETTKNITVSDHSPIPSSSPEVPSSDPSPTASFFYDNFDDGIADGWTQWSGSFSVINGEYCISGGVGGDPISTVDGLSFSDCTIETKLRFTDSLGFRAGIIFRFIDPTHYYSVELSNEYDALSIIKYTPEQPSYGELFADFRTTNPLQRETDYILKVIITGNTFRCFIDGELVLTGTDDSYTVGGVGVKARAAGVSFDYFKISQATPFELLNPEMMAWWKLNEGNGTTVFDSSGYNYRGTIHGANWLNYQGTSSLNFDGVSDYVSLLSLYLKNLDSLTVVAWINSDLTKAGYIYFHGDNGVFELSNGHLPNGRLPEINITHARFGVKLYPSGWYNAWSSPLKPNCWHQLVGVWVKGVSVKIYIDGVLAGEIDSIPSERLEDAGTSFPSSLGIYSQGQRNREGFFKGQISNAMVFNKALTVQEINALYDNVTIPTVARPILDVSSKSSSSISGFNVEIKGSLTLNETKVANAPILLSYSVNGGKSWQDLTLVNTAFDGTYSATWNPSVTGIYLIRAVYEGDANYLGTTTEVNLSVTQDTEKNVFSVNSNSTVSSLTFNSTSRALSFSVTGDSGTTGYADVYIAKTLVQNAAGIEVFLDGNKLDHTVSSTDDSWLLHFVYSHSTHSVTVNLGPSAQVASDLLGNWTFYGAITAVVVIIGIAAFVLRKKRAKF